MLGVLTKWYVSIQMVWAQCHTNVEYPRSVNSHSKMCRSLAKLASQSIGTSTQEVDLQSTSLFAEHAG
jgi:hypothetical protein